MGKPPRVAVSGRGSLPRPAHVPGGIGRRLARPPPTPSVEGGRPFAGSAAPGAPAVGACSPHGLPRNEVGRGWRSRPGGYPQPPGRGVGWPGCQEEAPSSGMAGGSGPRWRPSSCPCRSAKAQRGRGEAPPRPVNRHQRPAQSLPASLIEGGRPFCRGLCPGVPSEGTCHPPPSGC